MKTFYVVCFCSVFCTPWLQIAYNTKILSSALPYLISDPEDRGTVILRNNHMYAQVYTISELKSWMPVRDFKMEVWFYMQPHSSLVFTFM